MIARRRRPAKVQYRRLAPTGSRNGRPLRPPAGALRPMPSAHRHGRCQYGHTHSMFSVTRPLFFRKQHQLSNAICHHYLAKLQFLSPATISRHTFHQDVPRPDISIMRLSASRCYRRMTMAWQAAAPAQSAEYPVICISRSRYLFLNIARRRACTVV